MGGRSDKNAFMKEIPAGGGVEYLHLSPTSRKWRRKGNPVPGGTTGPPCSWGIYIRGPGRPGWDSLEFETVKYGHESRGSRTWEWLRWRVPAAIPYYRFILPSGRMLQEDYESKYSVGKKEYWSWVSRGLSPRRTVWRWTASRKVTLTLTLIERICSQ
jgi:hypothetical protein